MADDIEVTPLREKIVLRPNGDCISIICTDHNGDVRTIDIPLDLSDRFCQKLHYLAQRELEALAEEMEAQGSY